MKEGIGHFGINLLPVGHLCGGINLVPISSTEDLTCISSHSHRELTPKWATGHASNRRDKLMPESTQQNMVFGFACKTQAPSTVMRL